MSSHSSDESAIAIESDDGDYNESNNDYPYEDEGSYDSDETDSEDAGAVGAESVYCHNFTWQISNFDSRLQQDKSDDIRLQSPLFTVNDSNKFRLKLRISISSQQEQGETVIITLCPQQRIDLHATVTLSILDEKGQIACSSVSKLQPDLEQGYELSSLLSIPSDQLIANKPLLYKGILTVMCKIEVQEDEIPNCDQRLMEFDEFESLLTNSIFSDFTFIVGEKKFHIHRAIVAIRSAVFADMFKVKVKDSYQNNAELEDITCPIFEELLRFIYTGRVSNMKDNALDLFMAAEKYAMNGLKRQCEDQLIKDLTSENVLRHLNIASTLDGKKLKSQCIEFIAHYADEVTNQPDFSLDELPKKVINEVFRAVANKRFKKDSD